MDPVRRAAEWPERIRLNEIVTLEQMVMMFDVNTETIRTWVKRGLLLPPFYMGKSPFWSRRAFRDFLRERTAAARAAHEVQAALAALAARAPDPAAPDGDDAHGPA